MKEHELAQLKALPLFNSLSEQRLKTLLRAGYLQKFPTGTALLTEGEQADFLYVLLEGTVQLGAQTMGDRQTTVEIVTPVDTFIIAAAVTDTVCLMTAHTLEPSRLLMIPATDLRAQITDDPQLAISLLAALSQNYRMLVRQLKDLKLRPGVERLGCYLLRLSHEQENETVIHLPVEKRLVAARLGMTPENVSRAFAALAEHGVRVERQQVHLDDIERLRARCRPDPLIDVFERDMRVAVD